MNEGQSPAFKEGAAFRLHRSGLLEDLHQKVGHQRIGDEVEHDRRDHDVTATLGLQVGRNGCPGGTETATAPSSAKGKVTYHGT